MIADEGHHKIHHMKFAYLITFSLLSAGQATAQYTGGYLEPHRPGIHFSPREHWMNDPNGLVYYHKTWHLFFQYFPGGSTWGPMHWGHASSTDLMHWTQRPVALYPDTLGYIFSGSVVADVHNTSGFGKDGKVPLVAVFTQHDPRGEKDGRLDFQNESLAFSLDDGASWTKYKGNPVLKNPGIKDFRDPKVVWNEKQKDWLLCLATGDRIAFYASRDLKKWTKQSEFGQHLGAHGGVWECPDLFPLQYHGKTRWVLLVSINPGGPNGGSATQYFIGNFDGKKFSTSQTDTRWVDQGTDNYAGVTWSGTGNRKVFLGWMSNWLYAQVVPTETWRSTMTLPRELSIDSMQGGFFLRSLPVKELAVLEQKLLKKAVAPNVGIRLTGPAVLNLSFNSAQSFQITLANNENEKWVAGFDASTGNYFIDRTQAGLADFAKGFAGKIYAKRVSRSNQLRATLVIDNSSCEWFADNGTTVMTSIFFPTQNYTSLKVTAEGNHPLDNISLTPLKTIWK